MSDTTRIEWTDRTWNPVRGCSRVSEGCRNCYAERQAARFVKPGQPFHGFAKVTAPRDSLDRTGGRRNGWTGRVELVPSKLEEPLRWRKPQRVFVNSMSDLFHEGLSFEDIASVFAIMAACPQHDFQVLTKRAARLPQFFAWLEDERVGGALTRGRKMARAVHGAMGGRAPGGAIVENTANTTWPLPNVWLGVSVEDQATADERIPLLLDTPAAVRFVSAEPLLGPVNLRLERELLTDLMDLDPERSERHRGTYPFSVRPEFRTRRHHALHWVIVGGESGPGARPCDAAWIRSIVEQCMAVDVAPFVKQFGAYAILDPRYNRTLPGWTRRLRHPKGGDPEEWPERLRVREFPHVARTPGGG